MPSFIVHSIAGEKIMEYLKLNGEAKNKFFIANLLPDAVKLDIKSGVSDRNLKKEIQINKKNTHFKVNNESVLAYPDVDYFLCQYHNLVEKDIVALGYFFHLYTDYYYFSFFLPKYITFLDANLNEIDKKSYNIYNKIDKTGLILKKQWFWNSDNLDGIYAEYNRINQYLIKKYNFSFDANMYIDYLKKNNFVNMISETDIKDISNLLYELNGYYQTSLNNRIEKLKIFLESDIDNFICEVTDSFLKKYKYFIDVFLDK